MSKKDYRVGGFYTYNQKLAEEHYNFNYVIVNHTRTYDFTDIEPKLVRAEFDPMYYYIQGRGQKILAQKKREPNYCDIFGYANTKEEAQDIIEELKFFHKVFYENKTTIPITEEFKNMETQNKNENKEYIYLMIYDFSTFGSDNEPDLLCDVRELIKKEVFEEHHKKRLCKIGMSTNPHSRIKAIETETELQFDFKYIFDTTNCDTMSIEKNLHRCYKKQRVRGEYFYFNPEEFLKNDKVKGLLISSGVDAGFTDFEGLVGTKTISLLSPNQQKSILISDHKVSVENERKKFLMLFSELLLSTQTYVTQYGLTPNYNSSEKTELHTTYISECKEIVKRAGV